jgi:hypothetical protein
MSTRRSARSGARGAQQQDRLQQDRLQQVLAAGMNRAASTGMPGGEEGAFPPAPQEFKCEVYLIPTTSAALPNAILGGINTIPPGASRPRVSGADGLSLNEEGDLLLVIAVSGAPAADDRIKALGHCNDRIITTLLARTESPQSNFWTAVGGASFVSQCTPTQSTNYYYYFTTTDEQKVALRLLLMRGTGVDGLMGQAFGDLGGEVSFDIGTRHLATYKAMAVYESLVRFPRDLSSGQSIFVGYELLRVAMRRKADAVKRRAPDAAAERRAPDAAAGATDRMEE